MIRILQIYDNYGINGGITSTIMNWYRNSNNEDVEFHFLASWKRTPSFDKEIQSLGGKVSYIYDTDNIGNYIIFFNRVKKFFRNNHMYDAVHLHAGPFCFPYLYYAKKYGIKVRIIHAHSIDIGNTRFSQIRNGFLLKPMKFLATDFFACSKEAAQAWFAKRGINNYKILNNGIDISKYKNAKLYREITRDKLGIKDSEKAIIHISNMTRIKNVPFVISTFSKLLRQDENYKLILVGKDKLPDEVKLKIKELKIEESVINYGVTSEVEKIIAASDICLMPSLSEGFGLVPIECQACQIPCIISPGFAKIVAASEYVTVEELNESKWVENILLCVNRKEDYKFKSARFYDEFDIRSVSKELQYQYEELIRSQR